MESGEVLTARLGIFWTYNSITLDLISPALGIEVVMFATYEKVSFDSSMPGSRTAVLNFSNPVYRSNINGVAVSGQLRWFEGDRVEMDVTVDDAGAVTSYTDLIRTGDLKSR